MILLAQTMMILRNELMKIKRQFWRDIIIILKEAGCLGNYAANNLSSWANALGLRLFAGEAPLKRYKYSDIIHTAGQNDTQKTDYSNPHSCPEG